MHLHQNSNCPPNPNQNSPTNPEADHVELSTIQDHNFSVASSLDAVDQEKLMNINARRIDRDNMGEENSDQNCIIQDLSKCSYKIDESVLNRLS